MVNMADLDLEVNKLLEGSIYICRDGRVYLRHADHEVEDECPCMSCWMRREDARMNGG